MNKIKGALQGWGAAIHAADEYLQKVFPRPKDETECLVGPQFYVDEIALMFNTYPEALQFATDAVMERDVSLFNRAADHVHTWPFDNHYDVDYLFLTLPDPLAHVRVECMAINNGFSALHWSRLHEMNGDMSAVHLSFKVQDIAAYRSVVDTLSAQEDCRLVQACRSTYGLFSYFDATVALEGRGLYLKPRVNLRDEFLKDKAAAAVEAENNERGSFGFPAIGGGFFGDTVPEDFRQSDRERESKRPIKDQPQA